MIPQLGASLTVSNYTPRVINNATREQLYTGITHNNCNMFIVQVTDNLVILLNVTMLNVVAPLSCLNKHFGGWRPGPVWTLTTKPII